MFLLKARLLPLLLLNFVHKLGDFCLQAFLELFLGFGIISQPVSRRCDSDLE